MIHLVYSNQSSEIKKVVKAIAKQSLPKRDDMNFVRYDGNNTLIQEIIDDANYVPLGYDKKVVAVDNCYFLMKPKPRNKIEADQDYDELLKYVNNESADPDACFILSVASSSIDEKNQIFKALKEKAKIVQIIDPDEKGWNEYVRAYLQRHNVVIDKDNFKYYEPTVMYYRKRNNVIKLSNNINDDYLSKIDNILYLCKLDDKNVNIDDIKLSNMDTIFMGDDFVLFKNEKGHIFKYNLNYDKRSINEINILLDSLS